MQETVSPLLGFLFGIMFMNCRCSRWRLATQGLAIAFAASIAATLVTGEYNASWLYIIADLATAVGGLTAALLSLKILGINRAFRSTALRNEHL
jgi:hypothetical protein